MIKQWTYSVDEMKAIIRKALELPDEVEIWWTMTYVPPSNHQEMGYDELTGFMLRQKGQPISD